MKVLHLLGGLALSVLAACGGSGGTTPTPNPAPTQTLASLRLPSNAIALTAGGTVTLTPVALDASGRTISGASGYTFATSASGVAELQNGGAVLGINAGTATVTVSLTRDGVTATTTATVTVTGSLPAAGSVAAGNADQTFTPPTLVVARNATVTYTFGALAHNVSFRTAAGAPTNIPTSTASSITRTFPAAGDFTYDCTLHAGMTGTVLVR
jgi:plastocyanin